MLLCAALVHGFLLAPAAGTAAAESPMDAAMNSMGRLMGNPAGYDPAQLADIKACMAEHNLTSFGDAAWGGGGPDGPPSSGPVAVLVLGPEQY